MKINYDEIFDFVKNYEIEDGNIFTLFGIRFYLITMDEGQTFYSTSTLIDGFDIYLNVGKNKLIVERMFFHEIVEILWAHAGKKINEAHILALSKEESYFGKRD